MHCGVKAILRAKLWLSKLLRSAGEKRNTKMRAAYLASLSFVDEQAGRLLNRLKSSNVWSNTSSYIFQIMAMR